MVPLSKSVRTNVIYNCVRVGINLFVPVIIFPYISKTLGPTNWGRISFSNSFLNYFTMIASLGVPSYGILAVAKCRQNKTDLNKTVSELFSLNICLMLGTYVLFFLVIALVPKLQEYHLLLYVFSVYLVTNVVSMEWLYGGLEEFRYITTRTVVVKVLTVICILIFVKDANDYIKYAYILAATAVGSSVLNLYNSRKHISFVKTNIVNWKRHIKPTLTFFAASIAGTINANTDSVMLGFLLGDYEVGLYSFSVKIKLFLTSIMTAALSTFIPRFASYVSQKCFDVYRKELRRVIFFTVFMASALASFGVAFSPEIIVALGGTLYSESQTPMCILSVCVLVLAFTWSIGVAVLQPLGKEKEYAIVMSSACIANVLLNAILIPVFGVSGAAFATLLTEILNAILFYKYAREFLGMCLKKSYYYIFVICSCLAAAITRTLLHFNSIHPFNSLVAGFFLFIILYFTFVYLLHKEFRTLANVEISRMKSVFTK